MERIKYTASKLPSWSWMAFKGPVKFVHDKFDDLTFIKDLNFDAEALTTTIWEFTDPGMKIAVGGGLIDLQGLEKGWISLDEVNEKEAEEAELPKVQYMAVVAKRRYLQADSCRFFVLFLRPKESVNQYERFGMGMLQDDCMLKKIIQGHVV